MKDFFEDFLKEKHAEDYHGTDDDMPDAYDLWCSNLDAEEMCQFAQMACEEAYQRGQDLVRSETKPV